MFYAYETLARKSFERDLPSFFNQAYHHTDSLPHRFPASECGGAGCAHISGVMYLVKCTGLCVLFSKVEFFVAHCTRVLQVYLVVRLLPIENSLHTLSIKDKSRHRSKNTCCCRV